MHHLVSLASGGPGRGGRGRFRAFFSALVLTLGAGVHVARGQAPQLVSSDPANNATDVPPDAPLVFTFDRDMNTDIPLVPSMPGLFGGNIEFEPAGAVMVEGTWSGNKRVLTCVPLDGWPPSTTITWKLNPPGTFFPLSSAAGTALATVSGRFTTSSGGGGGEVPALLSSIPANGVVGVSVTASVVFVFDQPMKTNVSVAGAIRWAGNGLDPARFTYRWSADGQTLTADYDGDLPALTAITWLLNWTGSTSQLMSAAGVPLPADTYSGFFTTGTSGGGGGGACQPDGLPETWGGYSLFKSGSYAQTSAADPQPAAESPFQFAALVTSPRNGPMATAGSVTLPNGTRKDLNAAPFGGYLAFYEAFTTSAALDAAYPGGTYILRFTQSGQPERQISLPVPADAPPVPKITNYDAAQAVNPALDFTLQWNAFTGASGQDSLSLSIVETNLAGGNVVFQAPDRCVPRELPVTATSIVIPAGTLQSNRAYRASLTFNKVGYASTNTVPEMAGFAGVTRTTEFTLRTGGGAVVGTPARFTGFRLLPNGQLELTFTGTPNHPYTLQRATSLSDRDWVNAGSVTTDATGRGVFVDTAGGLPAVRFYRATTN